MLVVNRSEENPILLPNRENDWEAESAFNPSILRKRGAFRMVYRAVSRRKAWHGVEMEVSSIGQAVGRDGVHFRNHSQLVKPTESWEKFGCEDPRVTEFEGRYFIFYTALSGHPFSAESIKVAVAVTKDFKKIEKHPVTPFNAKAMALFPKRVNGKIAALLTVHTDKPPARICLALFDKIEDIWSEAYWREWYKSWESHIVPFEMANQDHIELGTAPIETRLGWLVFYSYIYNYFSGPVVFGVQAALLDRKNPQTILGEIERPFMIPEEEYERYGKVPNIIFPSGACKTGKDVSFYYGAADTTGCLAKINLEHLLTELIGVKRRGLKRFEGNPILTPIESHSWEASEVFNPAALYAKGKVHILYRAMSKDNTSVFGYASSRDGLHVSERLPEPVYVPREEFEQKLNPGGNSGCEDPRLTKLGDTIYMCYTAFDGRHPPGVALTSIAATDFTAKRWKWTKPIRISSPDRDDKDAAIFPKKINGKYAILHRVDGVSIWLDLVPDLKFSGGKVLGGKILMSPLETAWDSVKIGIAGPPIETSKGWLLLYHGVSRRGGHYKVHAALLDKKDPTRILYRTRNSILKPKMAYEKEGVVPNVVFPCSAVVIKKKLFVYYGGADRVVGVATIELNKLLGDLLREVGFHSAKKRR